MARSEFLLPRTFDYSFPGAPRAWDFRSLGDEPEWTRKAFGAEYGADAGDEWLRQHEEELSKVYGTSNEARSATLRQTVDDAFRPDVGSNDPYAPRAVAMPTAVRQTAARDPLGDLMDLLGGDSGLELPDELQLPRELDPWWQVFDQSAEDYDDVTWAYGQERRRDLQAQRDRLEDEILAYPDQRRAELIALAEQWERDNPVPTGEERVYGPDGSWTTRRARRAATNPFAQLLSDLPRGVQDWASGRSTQFERHARSVQDELVDEMHRRATTERERRQEELRRYMEEQQEGQDTPEEEQQRFSTASGPRSLAEMEAELRAVGWPGPIDGDTVEAAYARTAVAPGGQPLYETVNGPRTISEMEAELYAVGWGGPINGDTVQAAYTRTTGGAVTQR